MTAKAGHEHDHDHGNVQVQVHARARDQVWEHRDVTFLTWTRACTGTCTVALIVVVDVDVVVSSGDAAAAR